MSNPRARARFQREGYIASRVRHEGVVSILDDDATDDGTAFLVMDLLRGSTLEEHRRERGGTLPVDEVLLLTDRILDVLGAAHSGGVIHRDVKPSNVFLTTSGGLKLLDFGVASLREFSGGPNGTRSGALLGTPGFVAPEQARGRWREVDARTDVWAVGATMFRLLSGRLVHEAETANEAVIAAATLPAPPLAATDASLSTIAEVVDKALRAAPGDRWQSAAEMQAAVRAMLAAFPEARFPTPRSPTEPTTLDESAPPDAGAAAKAPLVVERSAAGSNTPTPRRSLARVLVAAGAAGIGAAAFIWAGQRPPPPAASIATNRASLVPAAAPRPRAADTPRAAPPPADEASVGRPPVESAPVLTPAAAAPTRKRARRAGVRVPPAPVETSTAQAGPSAAPPAAEAASDAPSRLEDVLGERH